MRRVLEVLGSGWSEQVRRFRLSINAKQKPSQSSGDFLLAAKMAAYSNFSDYEEFKRYRYDVKLASEDKTKIVQPPKVNSLALIWPPNYARAILGTLRVTIGLLADNIKNDTVRKYVKGIFGFLPFVGELILYPVTQFPSRLAYENKQKTATQKTDEGIEMSLMGENKEEPIENWEVPVVSSITDEPALLSQVFIPEKKERTVEAANIDIFIRNMNLDPKHKKKYLKDNMKELLAILTPQDPTKAANIADALIDTFKSNETRGEQLLKALKSLKHFPPTGRKVEQIIETKMKEAEERLTNQYKSVT